MKVYMYSEEEAIKNNCKYSVNSLPNVLFWIFSVILVLASAIYYSVKLGMLGEGILYKIISIIPWAIFLGYFVYSLRIILKEIKKRSWSTQMAFIKEDDTLWAVKLTYFFIPTVALTDSALSTALTMPAAIHSVKTTKALSKELGERKLDSQNYINALNEARKPSAKIMQDMDNNFPLIFNGRQCVTRLDNIKYIGETDKTETYTYNDYRGIERELVINKAYPGFKEEVLNTPPVEHKYPFPKNYKRKISDNAFYCFLILLALFLAIPFLIGILKGLLS